MTKPYRSHEEALWESLSADPDFAEAYLSDIAIRRIGERTMTAAIRHKIADALKWFGWRLIRLADRLDD